jgi:hypothetical protein
MKYLKLNILYFLLIFSQILTGQDFSGFPGIVINHSAASSKIYLGSASIVILPNGHYLASHDYYGPVGDTINMVTVFLSTDKGKTWKKQSDVAKQFWSGMFLCNGNIYMLGTSKIYGYISIRRSTDEGKSWTMPTGSNNGLLKKGQYHCAPTPILFKNGRIYRGFEKVGKDKPGKWCSDVSSFIMSAPITADLLNADSWSFSSMSVKPENIPGTGWLETNAVELPDGRITGITRLHTETDNIAGIYFLSKDEKTIDTLSIKTIKLPGAAKKFTIRYDKKSKLYWSLTNYPPDTLRGINHVERMRSVLTLVSSPDLNDWTIRNYVLYSPDVKKVGFQYVDFLFEGDDIVFVSRTSFDDGLGGANDCHNSNFLSFHRIQDFRNISMNKVTFDVDKYLPPQFDPDCQISLSKNWKFALGDNADWSDPKYDDSKWKNIETGKIYEAQGYDYDGFSWYRLKVVIPSWLKNKSKGQNLLIELGRIDDGDETFLNGSLIGINAGMNKNIKDGGWSENRIYELDLANPSILWDQENLIAVRVWDKGNDGGMYAGNYRIGLRKQRK